MARLVRAATITLNKDNHLLFLLGWAEKHLRTHNTPNPEEDALPPEMTTLGFTPVRREQESEDTEGADFPKLDSER